MTRILAHLSDLHFGAHDPVMAERLLATLERIGPDLVVISGDLTQHARAAEFLEAARFLARLPARSLVVPGNHDVPGLHLLERLRRPFARYRTHIAADLSPQLADDELAVIGLNSARPFGWHWSWAHGRLSRSQLDLVERALHHLPDRLWKLVVTHHPFLPPAADPHSRLVGGATRALERFAACGVDLLLAGHVHRAYHGDVRSLHTRIRRSILVVQAATAISTRLRGEPNAFNRLVLEEDRVTVQSWLWAGDGFGPGARQDFVHRRDSWRPRPPTTAQTPAP